MINPYVVPENTGTRVQGTNFLRHAWGWICMSNTHPNGTAGGDAAIRFDEPIAAPFLQVVGHKNSEVAGTAFSPNGTRLYISLLRGSGSKYDNLGLTCGI